MPKPQIVAMAGMTQGGKTTCAEYLSKQYGLRQHAFVDHFKHALRGLHPELTDRELWGGGREERKHFLGGRSVREALIDLSTKERATDPGCAVRRLETEIGDHHGAVGWVLSDCRHPVELEWAADNAVVIKLLRGTRKLIRSGNTRHFDWHVATRKLPYTIDNEVCSLEDLYDQLDEIMAAQGFLKP